MNDLRKAAEMALEALQHANDVCLYERCEEDFYTDEINALRQALAAEEALDRMVAENQRLGLYGEDLQPAIEKGTEAWADVPETASEWVDKLRGNDTPEETPEVTPEVPCKTHPDAPHGFNRNASFDEDRYVCDCEFWEPDVDNSAHEAEDVHGNVDAVNINDKRVHKIEKSVHEPVAIVNVGMGGIEWLEAPLPDDTPLYAAPPKQEYQYEVVAEHADGTYTTRRIPKRQWVGLTNEEIDSVWKTEYFNLSYELPRAIEAKLKEKNT